MADGYGYGSGLGGYGSSMYNGLGGNNNTHSLSLCLVVDAAMTVPLEVPQPPTRVPFDCLHTKKKEKHTHMHAYPWLLQPVQAVTGAMVLEHTEPTAMAVWG